MAPLKIISEPRSHSKVESPTYLPTFDSISTIMITFYDIPSTVPSNTWSPNTSKTRLVERTH